jgi:hypothetical protein
VSGGSVPSSQALANGVPLKESGPSCQTDIDAWLLRAAIAFWKTFSIS